jgi:hypothetical protein
MCSTLSTRNGVLGRVAVVVVDHIWRDPWNHRRVSPEATGLKVGTMLMLLLLFVALLMTGFAFVPMVCFFIANSALNPVFVLDMLTHTYSHVDRPGTFVCGHTTQ